jgi:ABC-2 type transport system ATP-binding protein
VSIVARTVGLTKRYGRSAALDNLTFELTQGSIYGLIGPNGAGKTTALKMLMNMVAPTAGRAEVLGADSRQLQPQHFARIGYVSEGQEMPDWMTVESLLAYLKPFYPTWDRQRARELIDQFQLPRGRRLRQLSRGMRMKAALVASLAYRPALLVLDEPFSGLDALVRDELTESLVDSAEETTILISSHELIEIESFATHFGYLDRGRLGFSERAQDLSARFREIEVTVDSPSPMPADRPAGWLNPESSGAVVRFVDSRFEESQLVSDVRRLFGETARIAIDPMPLRAIFVALARTSRGPAPS